MQMRCQALNLLINPKSIFAMQKQRGAGRLLNCRKQQMLTNMNAHFCQILAFPFFSCVELEADACWFCIPHWPAEVMPYAAAVCWFSLGKAWRCWVTPAGVQCILFCPWGAVWKSAPCLTSASARETAINPPTTIFFFFFHSIRKCAMCSTWIFLTATTSPKPWPSFQVQTWWIWPTTTSLPQKTKWHR